MVTCHLYLLSLDCGSAKRHHYISQVVVIGWQVSSTTSREGCLFRTLKKGPIASNDYYHNTTMSDTDYISKLIAKLSMCDLIRYLRVTMSIIGNDPSLCTRPYSISYR